MMYLVTIGEIYVKAGSPATAMRQVIRSIENQRFITEHAFTTVEAIGVDEPWMYDKSSVGKVLLKALPAKGKLGQFSVKDAQSAKERV